MKTNRLASLSFAASFAASLTVITSYAQMANGPTFDVASVKLYND